MAGDFLEKFDDLFTEMSELKKIVRHRKLIILPNKKLKLKPSHIKELRKNLVRARKKAHTARANKSRMLSMKVRRKRGLDKTIKRETK